MKTTNPLDAARIELLLSELRLPAIKLMWAKFAEQADKEGWPAARFLAALFSEIEDVIPSRSRPDRGMIRVRSETRNQHGQIVQILVAKLVVPRRNVVALAPASSTSRDAIAQAAEGQQRSPFGSNH